MKIHVGTSGFAHKEWKGKFYPEKISPKEMLRFYSERLNTVEINNTFYHMPKESVLTSWAEQVGGDFVFALKAPQVITHMKQHAKCVRRDRVSLQDAVNSWTRNWGRSFFSFPRVFVQTGPRWKIFSPLIPGNMACAFDFRSPSWLDNEILDILREKGCSLVHRRYGREPDPGNHQYGALGVPAPAPL